MKMVVRLILTTLQLLRVFDICISVKHPEKGFSNVDAVIFLNIN